MIPHEEGGAVEALFFYIRHMSEAQ